MPSPPKTGTNCDIPSPPPPIVERLTGRPRLPLLLTSTTLKRYALTLTPSNATTGGVSWRGPHPHPEDDLLTVPRHRGPHRRERCLAMKQSPVKSCNDEALLAAALTGFTWSSCGLVQHLG